MATRARRGSWWGHRLARSDLFCILRLQLTALFVVTVAAVLIG